VNRWLDNMYITGSAKPTIQKGQSSVVPKLIRKQAEWRYSSLSEPFLSTEDVFNVAPTTAGDKKRAKQNEMVLNNQFNTQIKKVSFIDTYVREIVDTGTVIVKVGWETEEETVIEDIPIFEFTASDSPKVAEYYHTLAQLKASGDEEYMDYSTPGLDQSLDLYIETGQVSVATQVGVEQIEVIKETKNQPTLMVCNPDNIIIDPSCEGNISEASFVCEKFKTCLSDLRKDGRYTNLDKINVEGASPLANPDYVETVDNENFNFEDKPRKQFVVHIYWGDWDIDGEGKTKAIVAYWVNDILIRMEENPFPDQKPPFVEAIYRPVRNSHYGSPDGELLDDNQQIVGAVTRGMLDLLGKSANSQTGSRKDMLDTTNMRKFKRGEDYQFNAGVEPRQGFYTHVFPEIPQSATNMIMMQNAEAESLTGVKAFHSGITGQALGDVATSVRGVLDATSKRELSILRRIASGIIDIGRKIISMNAAFLSDEEVIRITSEQFITIRRDDLPGNFDLTLSISTAEEDNKKAEELAFMLQTMGHDSDPQLYKMILSDIARLRKMPAMAKKIEEYQPQPDPLAVAEQQLQIKLLEAQIAKEQALALKHQTEAEANMGRGQRDQTQAALNMAKGGTEEAKARHLTSMADKEDLNYLEQEAGVQQERNLEQLDAKHRSEIAKQDNKAELDVVTNMLNKE
ncbi:MAG: chromosome partitioning protein ParB, partial [Nanoarchaeota archaeon]|nr:chromosome partitioning protein ParB [Nanoarchaeota archaeon]